MTEQNLFILYAIPSEKIAAENGARKITLLYAAANIRQARAMAPLKFLEQYPDADDADFELVVYEDAPGLPRGALNVWDEEILSGYNWNEEARRPEPRAALPIEFEKLSSIMKIAVLVKYMTTKITSDMLPAALELTLDEASSFPGHIVEAISKTPTVASTYPERIIEAIQYVVEKCPTTKKWPEIKAQLINWLKEHEKESEDGNVKPVVDPVGATEYTGRAYKHTYDTLNKEIAYALWAGDVDPAKTEASISRWAAGIIADDREDWKRWSAVITTQENILEYDRPTIFNVVRSAPTKDIYHFPDTLKRYVSDYLQTRGVYEGEAHEKEQPTPQGTTGALADDQSSTNTVEQEQPAGQSPEAPETVTERQGPFYFLMSDGQKFGRANKIAGLEKAISDGGTEISQEEYQARKTGTYAAPQNDAPQPTPEETGRQLAAQRGEYVEGISDPDDPKWVKTEEKQPEVKSMGDGMYSIEGLMGEQQQAAAPEAANETRAAAPEDAKSVIASVEEMSADNLELWKSVFKTDERFTKAFSVNGGGTSINGTYMAMIATREFGLKGIGWGVEILEERFDNGAPITRTVKGPDGNNTWELIPDGTGGILTEKHHVIKIKLWYIRNGARGNEIAFGCTPYLYGSKYGPICDGEAPKKSLTDATKKALSGLGFSGDIFMGLYDNPEYRQKNKAEFDLINASENAEDAARIRTELDEKMTRVANTIESAVTANEAKKVFDTLAREVEIHRKAAEGKGDAEHAKYLSGRLRRLNQIKDERIKALNEQEYSA